MKTVVTLIFITLFNGLVFSQLENQDKIIEVYGQDWFEKTESTNPGLIKILDRFVELGFVVEEIVDEKYFGFEQMEFIPLRDKNSATVSVSLFLEDYYSGDFNPLTYGFFPNQNTQIIKLMGVSKIIKILPSEELLKN